MRERRQRRRDRYASGSFCSQTCDGDCSQVLNDLKEQVAVLEEKAIKEGDELYLQGHKGTYLHLSNDGAVRGYGLGDCGGRCVWHVQRNLA